MAEEELKKVEPEKPSGHPAAPETTSEPPPPAVQVPESTNAPKDVAEENSVVVPVAEEKPDDSNALAVVEKPVEPPVEVKPAEGSINRDAVLQRVATEKRLSLIKAWEESEKSKAENKAQKKLSAIGAWENSKNAAIEAELSQIEAKLEKRKAEYVEKMKNKIATLHRQAEEKRATIEAKRGEDILKAEETAAKYRATGTSPKKLLGLF